MDILAIKKRLKDLPERIVNVEVTIGDGNDHPVVISTGTIEVSHLELGIYFVIIWLEKDVIKISSRSTFLFID